MATLQEFTATMRYLEAGVNLAAERRPTKEQTAVYFDLLGDLPADVLHAAVQRVLLEHTFPTLPAPGLIRNAALGMTAAELPGPEAWRLVWQAVRHYGLDNYAQAKAKLPPLVARAVDCFGWRTLCDSKDAELTKTRWVKDYEQLAAAERREAALPPSLRVNSFGGSVASAMTDSSARGSLPAGVKAILGGIGQPVNGAMP